nr:caspase-14-like [Aedes albopictus]
MSNLNATNNANRVSRSATTTSVTRTHSIRITSESSFSRNSSVTRSLQPTTSWYSPAGNVRAPPGRNQMLTNGSIGDAKRFSYNPSGSSANFVPNDSFGNASGIPTPSPTSPPVIPTPRSSNCEQERYDLSKPACVAIFHHVFKNNPAMFREGSQRDYDLLLNFFGELNANVKYRCEDFKAKKVKETVKKIRNKNFDKYSCLIVIIMSHGEAKDQIWALDKCYNLEADVVDRIRENRSLRAKPKLFIVQACKGEAMMEPDYTPTAPNAMNIMKCYSTYEGTVSFRDTNEGSFFIQTLIKLIKENPLKDISHVLVLLRNKFITGRIMQAPTDTSTLTKTFYFADLRKP